MKTISIGPTMAYLFGAIKAEYEPNNASACSYKTNLWWEASKLAEMNSQADQKSDYHNSSMKQP
jgi:hypothetical protein